MSHLVIHTGFHSLHAVVTTAGFLVAPSGRARGRKFVQSSGRAGVSVVIPTFRRHGPLREAIESALMQTDVDVEVIVVDDSPEGSAREMVLGLNDSRVRFEQPAVPSGGRPGMPRNHGAGLTTKEFVHFLDDDDRLAAGALSALTDALRAHPEVGVAMGVVKPFGDNPEALAHEEEYFRVGADALRRMRSRAQLTRLMLFGTTPLVNSSCMVRRACLPDIGGYSPVVKYVEDVDFYLRAIRRFGFVFVDRPVLEYRTGTPSLMHSLEDLSVLRESYRNIYANYRASFGRLDFLRMKIHAHLGRLSSRMIPGRGDKAAA